MEFRVHPVIEPVSLRETWLARSPDNHERLTKGKEPGDLIDLDKQLGVLGQLVAVSKVEAADSICLSSKATILRNEELRRYIRAFVSKAKYVNYCEPVWALSGNMPCDTCDLNSKESVPACAKRDPLAGSHGNLCWNHDCAGMLEESGFDAVINKVYKPNLPAFAGTSSWPRNRMGAEID
jgi:hypothetical protein